MSEEWKPVVGYEGLYEVSNMGNVRLLRSGKIAKLSTKSRSCGGYRVLTLIRYLNGVRQVKTAHVHRLVAEAFIPNPDNKPCIDHINTDPTDNRVSNLRWSTYMENNRNPITWNKHLAAHRTQEYHNKMTSPEMRSMYSSEEHKEKCRLGASWHMRAVTCVETGEVWSSIREASRATGINTTTISHMCSSAKRPDYRPMKIQNGNAVRHFIYYNPNNSNQGE